MLVAIAVGPYALTDFRARSHTASLSRRFDDNDSFMERFGDLTTAQQLDELQELIKVCIDRERTTHDRTLLQLWWCTLPSDSTHTNWRVRSLLGSRTCAVD